MAEKQILDIQEKLMGRSIIIEINDLIDFSIICDEYIISLIEVS